MISDRQRLGGRPKGKSNRLNRDTHSAILEALARVGCDISKTEVREGLVAFIVAAVKEDLGRGVKLLQTITPRMLDVTVEKTSTIKYKSLEEVRQDLQRRGIASIGEIFRVDYVGSNPADPEPVEGEILPPRLKQNP
jgi:hypothetical protein